MANDRLSGVFITLNNWQDLYETKTNVDLYFKSIDVIKYGLIGFEIGEKKQTPHLQAVFQFTKQIRFNAVKELFPNAHIEKIIDINASIEYCKKENDFIEWGTPTLKKGQRNDLNDFVDAIKNGYTNAELLNEFPSQFLRYDNKIQNIRKTHLFHKYTKENRQVQVVYAGGVAGIGKTRAVYDTFGYDQVYRVSSYINPFDNYNGEKVLVLDEFNSSLEFNELLNILDIYPTMLRSRYNDKVACYDVVIILSNIGLEQNYFNVQKDVPEKWKALMRRVHYEFWLNDTNNELISYLTLLAKLNDELF